MNGPEGSFLINLYTTSTLKKKLKEREKKRKEETEGGMRREKGRNDSNFTGISKHKSLPKSKQ